MAYYLSQNVNGYDIMGTPIRLSGSGDWRYCSITFTADIDCDDADMVRIQIYDGVNTSSSAYHTGGGEREVLSVTHTIDGEATEITARIEVQEPQATAGVTIRDCSLTMDHFNREIQAGCPCCGSLTYDGRRQNGGQKSDTPR